MVRSTCFILSFSLAGLMSLAGVSPLVGLTLAAATQGDGAGPGALARAAADGRVGDGVITELGRSASVRVMVAFSLAGDE